MLTAICFRHALPGGATLLAVTAITVGHPVRPLAKVTIDPDARSAPAVNNLGSCTKRPIRVDGVRGPGVASRAAAA
jgi:hypothetical protein